MANLYEAFGEIYKTNNIFNNNIEHFFNQRTVMKEDEYIDKNMIRKNKKKKVVENFLSVRMPTLNNNILPHTFDIEIFGNIGYHYTGIIITKRGIIPDFTINIKSDNKIFVHIRYNIVNSNTKIDEYKDYISFIDVPKRFRTDVNNIQDDDNKLNINTNDDNDDDDDEAKQS